MTERTARPPAAFKLPSIKGRRFTVDTNFDQEDGIRLSQDNTDSHFYS